MTRVKLSTTFSVCLGQIDLLVQTAAPPVNKPLVQPIISHPLSLPTLEEISVELASEKEVEHTDSGDAADDTDLDDAADLLRSRIKPEGTALEHARFSRLRALVKARRCTDVLVAEDEYQKSNHSGAHSEDVLYFQIYCQAKQGRLTESRKLLEKYLIDFPKGRYWDRVRDILGE